MTIDTRFRERLQRESDTTILALRDMAENDSKVLTAPEVGALNAALKRRGFREVERLNDS